MRIAAYFAVLRADQASDRVVPPTGVTARLTVFSAAAMALLAVVALAVSLAASGVAARWADALERVATIEVTSADSADVARVLSVLQTTPGIASASEIAAERQAELLRPWLGDAFPLDTLSLPRLIEVREDATLDRAGLILRLEAEVPSAHYILPDDWQRQVAGTALRVRWIGWLLVGVTAAVMAAMITLAASAALASNRVVIETLRLIGAEDEFIARAFVRRFTLRGAMGAALGTVLGVAIVMLVSRGEGLGVALVPGLAGWLAFVSIPLVAGFIAFAATQAAARRALARLT